MPSQPDGNSLFIPKTPKNADLPNNSMEPPPLRFAKHPERAGDLRPVPASRVFGFGAILALPGRAAHPEAVGRRGPWQLPSCEGIPNVDATTTPGIQSLRIVLNSSLGAQAPSLTDVEDCLSTSDGCLHDSSQAAPRYSCFYSHLDYIDRLPDRNPDNRSPDCYSRVFAHSTSSIPLSFSSSSYIDDASAFAYATLRDRLNCQRRLRNRRSDRVADDGAASARRWRPTALGSGFFVGL